MSVEWAQRIDERHLHRPFGQTDWQCANVAQKVWRQPIRGHRLGGKVGYGCNPHARGLSDGGGERLFRDQA